MKSRRRCVVGCNGPIGWTCVSQPIFLRRQQVLEIDWVAGDIHGAPLGFARTAEAHHVGAWSFVFFVFPGLLQSKATKVVT